MSEPLSESTGHDPVGHKRLDPTPQLAYRDGAVGDIIGHNYWRDLRARSYAPVIDPVNQPAHYKQVPGIECIEVTQHFNFNLGNAIKYVWRSGEKGKQVEDLRKARWYIDRELVRLEREASPLLTIPGLADNLKAVSTAGSAGRLRNGHGDHYGYEETP